MEQNNNTFNNIKSLIEALEYYAAGKDASADIIIMSTKNKLLCQFERAASAEWSKSELSDFIFENDAFDDEAIVSDNFKDDVREIQNAMINFFA